MDWLMKLIRALFSNSKVPEQPETPRSEPTPAPEEPKEVKPMYTPGSMKDAISRYGEIKDSKWMDEGKWMVVFRVPEDIAIHWINSATGQPTRKIYCNRDLVAPLTAALSNLKDRGLLQELKTFDGCFMIRDIRGVPGKPSTHSYGLAIDLNAKENGLGKEPKLSPEFVTCFKDAGFVWGGGFTRKDGMHFQFVRD